jgi:hypothetical protein
MRRKENEKDLMTMFKKMKLEIESEREKERV